VELAGPSGDREAAGEVRPPVAKLLGLGVGRLAIEERRLGPDDRVGGEHRELEPHLGEGELLDRELGQSGVLVLAAAVLDPGGLAVAALEGRDVLIWLVGEDRLEAVSRRGR